MFDEKTQKELKSYVYMLIDPLESKPFYIGKGKNNRIFDHLNRAILENNFNLKYDKIKEIVEIRKQSVKHLIIRHGLSEVEAFQIEASIIDSLNYLGFNLLNQQIGHYSIEKGLMTSDEIIRKYNAIPLDKIESNCVLININKTYNRSLGADAIYQATKETWFIDKNKINKIKYVLSEYKGLIVEVFEVNTNGWYEKLRNKNISIRDQNGKIIFDEKGKKVSKSIQAVGFGFDGNIAPFEIRDKYLNKSVAHKKSKGQANVIRYNL